MLGEREHKVRVISPNQKLFHFGFKELFQYRDLILSFVNRDLSTIYKQTILGPIWFVLSPLLTVAILSVVFGRIVEIPTNGVPKILFYLLGITFWNYFSTNVNSISSTFQSYSGIYTKVYFPRMVAPIAQIISNSVKFAIQFLLFICFYIAYNIYGYNISVGRTIIYLPLVLICFNLLAMGIGLIITSISIRYRDANHFMSFGLNILFYITPIIYPMEIVPKQLSWIVQLNPLVSYFELLKMIFFNSGNINASSLLLSLFVTLFVFICGVILFNRNQRSFADTI